MYDKSMNLPEHNENPLIIFFSVVVYILGLVCSTLTLSIDLSTITQFAELVKTVVAIGGTVASTFILCIVHKEKLTAFKKSLTKKKH